MANNGTQDTNCLPPSRTRRISKSLGKMFDRVMSYLEEAEDRGDDSVVEALKTARDGLCEAWSATGQEA